MFVNSAILIVAGAALYGSPDAQTGDLFSIHDLLSTTLSPIPGTLFALTLFVFWTKFVYHCCRRWTNRL